MIRKAITLIYGLFSYTLFVVIFSYAILFIGNIGVSPSLDSPGGGNMLEAVFINIGLLSAFALQHSVMARPAIKRLMSRIIPEAMERSTYVLASSILLGMIVYFWQPLGGVIWQLSDTTKIALVYGIFALGWAVLFLASFQINHFDLFGLRQSWLYFRGKAYTPLTFTIPGLYRYVRHPLYVGLIMGIWATPTMTIAHLLFALMCTAYTLVGAKLEERDLERTLPEYKRYQSMVPMFVPAFTNRNDNKFQTESL